MPAPPTLLPCSVAAVSVRSRSMIASRSSGGSAGHVDVDGVVGHGGDDIVVGAGNSPSRCASTFGPGRTARIVHWSSGAIHPGRDGRMGVDLRCGNNIVDNSIGK